MILIFDTYGGLCNQFYDIQCAVNFCLINKIGFTFRYASFRNKDLTSWYNVPFDQLFDVSFLEKYPYYVNYNVLSLNNKNTYNYDGKLFSNQLLKREHIIEQLKQIVEPHIVLKQFWDTFFFTEIIDEVYPYLKPCKKIMKKYLEINNELSLVKNNYNFLHYRYESDFKNHFHIADMQNLSTHILQNSFVNKDLKMYIATTDIMNLLKDDLNKLNPFILYKNENNLNDFNFEERAFIDYMIGLNSKEVYGHSKSSFSNMLNSLKKTNNYYE
jgi:hypothetical protein